MNLNLSKASAATRKIQIEQNVPSGSIRKGPYAIERSVDPNEVVIKRRFGEGSKPLFQRDDIVVNPNSVANTADAHSEKQLVSGSGNSSKDISKQCRKERHTSTDSSSPERYQKYHNSHNNPCATGSNNRVPRRTNLLKPTSDTHGSAGKRTVRRDQPPSSHRLRTPEKVPYFLDEVREHDRLLRKYGSRSKKSSASPPLPSRRRRRSSRSKSRSRSLSGSAAQFKHRTQSQPTHLRRSISRDRYLGEASRRDREKPRSDKVRHKTYTTNYRRRSEDQSKNGHRRRSSRSPSRSRSRSRDRLTHLRTQSSHDERGKNRHGEHDRASNDALAQRNLPQPQIITIPVPVPAEFMNYGYPSWPTATQWTPQMTHPPRYGAPTAYHLPTILPASVMPSMRPPLPPYGLSLPPLRYAGRGFRHPMHYGASRPWRPNFRSKNT